MYSVVIYNVLTNTRIRIPALTETEAREICQLHAPLCTCRKVVRQMESYEDFILASQEDDFSDDCSSCPYKGIDTCQNQCMMETVTIFSIEEGRYIKQHNL